jgi:hypothetical protein
MEENIICLWVHAKVRTDIGEKSIKIGCVHSKVMVHNSCNVPHVTHGQVGHTPKK